MIKNLNNLHLRCLFHAKQNFKQPEYNKKIKEEAKGCQAHNFFRALFKLNVQNGIDSNEIKTGTCLQDIYWYAIWDQDSEISV